MGQAIDGRTPEGMLQAGGWSDNGNGTWTHTGGQLGYFLDRRHFSEQRTAARSGTPRPAICRTLTPQGYMPLNEAFEFDAAEQGYQPFNERFRLELWSEKSWAPYVSENKSRPMPIARGRRLAVTLATVEWFYHDENRRLWRVHCQTADSSTKRHEGGVQYDPRTGEAESLGRHARRLPEVRN